MKIALHPEAEKNFNTKVEGLLKYIEKKISLHQQTKMILFQKESRNIS